MADQTCEASHALMLLHLAVRIMQELPTHHVIYGFKRADLQPVVMQSVVLALRCLQETRHHLLEEW